MPNIDLLRYHDFTDTLHAGLPPVGQNAAEWFGEGFEDLYVVAVGPPVHNGKDATVILAHESRPDMAQGLKGYVAR